MLSRPLLTIAVCTFNGEAYLEKTLNSILTQDYGNYEVVVVDDGSNDGTTSIIERFAMQDGRIRPCFRSNHGLAASRKFAFGMARGEWIAIIDQDDLCYPARLSMQLETAERFPTAGLIFCNTHHIDEADKVIGNHLSGFVLPESFIRKRDGANLLLRLGCFIDSEACFVKRETVDKLGPLDETLVYACDYDYFIRAGFEVDFAYSTDILAAWRVHAKQATKTYRKIGNEIRSVFWRNCWNNKVKISTKAMLLWKIFKSYIGDAVGRTRL